MLRMLLLMRRSCPNPSLLSGSAQMLLNKCSTSTICPKTLLRKHSITSFSSADNWKPMPFQQLRDNRVLSILQMSQTRSLCFRSTSRCCTFSNGTLRPIQSKQTIEQPSKRYFSSGGDKKPQRVNVVFETSDGERYEVYGYEGDSLYDVVLNRNVPLDGYGACEATLACSTCHVILSEPDFDRIENEFDSPASDEELDMLDLAYDLSDTSRLGCQIILRKEMDGMVVKVPSGVADARLA